MENEIRPVVSILPILVFSIPTAFGIITVRLGRFSRLFRVEWSILGLAATFITSILIVKQVLAGDILTYWNSNFYVDGLSALMEILGAGIGLIVIIYSVRGQVLSRCQVLYF
jgi:NADH:ubiquinone oxidoreductase subunit 5 (subunit L)/multisubunit Na+/H+ antiporter MnhA subunit